MEEELDANLTTSISNYLTLSINKSQVRNVGKVASFPSPRKLTTDSLKISGITLIAIAAKVYNALLFNHIRRNSLEKSERFSEKSIYNLTNSDNPSNYRRNTCKKSLSNAFVQRVIYKALCFDVAQGRMNWTPMRIELTRVGLLVKLANRYTTKGFKEFSQTFDSIHRGKTEQIKLAYGL